MHGIRSGMLLAIVQIVTIVAGTEYTGRQQETLEQELFNKTTLELNEILAEMLEEQDELEEQMRELEEENRTAMRSIEEAEKQNDKLREAVDVLEKEQQVINNMLEEEKAKKKNLTKMIMEKKNMEEKNMKEKNTTPLKKIDELLEEMWREFFKLVREKKALDQRVKELQEEEKKLGLSCRQNEMSATEKKVNNTELQIIAWLRGNIAKQERIDHLMVENENLERQVHLKLEEADGSETTEQQLKKLIKEKANAMESINDRIKEQRKQRKGTDQPLELLEEKREDLYDHMDDLLTGNGVMEDLRDGMKGENDAMEEWVSELNDRYEAMEEWSKGNGVEKIRNLKEANEVKNRSMKELVEKVKTLELCMKEVKRLQKRVDETKKEEADLKQQYNTLQLQVDQLQKEKKDMEAELAPSTSRPSLSQGTESLLSDSESESPTTFC